MQRKRLVLALPPGRASGLREALARLMGLAVTDGSPEWSVETLADIRQPGGADGTLPGGLAGDAILVVDAGFDSGALARRLPSLDTPAVLVFDPETDADLALECARLPHVVPLPAPGRDAGAAAVAVLARRALALQADRENAKAEAALATARFFNLVRALPVIAYVLDEEGHFIYLNDAVSDLGYEPAELIGRHFGELIHPDDRDGVSLRTMVRRIRLGDVEAVAPPKLFDERRSGSRMTRDLEVRLLARDGQRIVYGSVNAYGELGLEGPEPTDESVSGPVTVGLISDVSAARRYRLSLEENVAAKELLLREIHHRVKNNLQVVASLAHLTGMEMGEGESRMGMEGMIAQVRSMAMVHEALYQSENLAGVRASDYFPRFARLMEQSYGILGRPVELSVDSIDEVVEVETLANIALVANELVSNAYRHAFTDGRAGHVRIGFGGDAAAYVLEVADDGMGDAGPPGGAGARAAGAGEGKNAGLGREIVKALASQMHATVHSESGAGTRVTLRIPRPLPRADGGTTGRREGESY